MPTVADFAALENKKNQLIRKSLGGSLFVAPSSADAITSLTAMTTGGTPVVALNELPVGYDDFGYLTTDGMSFARSVSQSEVSSFGQITPTRTDVTADTGTLVAVGQETKLLTIGVATGADLASIVPDASTGEVRIEKPERPNPKHYRALGVSVDLGEGGEIYIGRFLPYAKVTDYAEQAYASGDTVTSWGVTFTAEKDSVLGFAEAWLFGGPGWHALLDDMGFGAG